MGLYHHHEYRSIGVRLSKDLALFQIGLPWRDCYGLLKPRLPTLRSPLWFVFDGIGVNWSLTGGRTRLAFLEIHCFLEKGESGEEEDTPESKFYPEE